MSADPPALAIRGVSKNYSALRPLRLQQLTVARGEQVSIGGLDAGAGELLVNLVTGASVPDAGEIHVFGQRTADIANGDAWLELLDRFGIVSPRAVMLEGSTLQQNLAMPFTLDIEPVQPDVAARVEALARECGVDTGRWLGMRAGDLPPDIRVLAHLARAVALDPDLLIVEHPTADVPAGARDGLAAAMARVWAARGVAALVLTNDDDFARAVAATNYKLDAATGALRPLRRGWFS